MCVCLCVSKIQILAFPVCLAFVSSYITCGYPPSFPRYKVTYMCTVTDCINPGLKKHRINSSGSTCKRTLTHIFTTCKGAMSFTLLLKPGDMVPPFMTHFSAYGPYIHIFPAGNSSFSVAKNINRPILFRLQSAT